MSNLHSTSLKERWQTLTLYEQMGNIGSEVGRSVSSMNKDTAFERALELFDLTLADTRWTGSKRREIARSRENFIESVTKNDTESLGGLNKYFFHFALAARLKK